MEEQNYRRLRHTWSDFELWSTVQTSEVMRSRGSASKTEQGQRRATLKRQERKRAWEHCIRKIVAAHTQSLFVVTAFGTLKTGSSTIEAASPLKGCGILRVKSQKYKNRFAQRIRARLFQYI